MILYFSATGNSEFVARKLSEIIDDEILNLLPKFRNNDTTDMFSKKPWVIVCPVYVAEMPWIVRDWLKVTKLLGNQNIYFVFTAASEMSCSGYFAKKLSEYKNMNYMGSCGIKMPTNYPIFFTVKEEFECVKIIKDSLEDIINSGNLIREGKTIPEKEVSKGLLAGTIPVNELYYKYFVKAKGFYATNDCIGCGICSKVCPYENISIIEKKPKWGNKCTHCMACLSTCPKEAIEYGKSTLNKRKYHFPNLEIKEEVMSDRNIDKKVKVVLAGAFGHLGSDILRSLVIHEYEVTAMGRTIRKPEGIQEEYKVVVADTSDKNSLTGICDGADIVISTVGLTKTSADTTYYDVDFKGNMNLLEEAKRAGVKNFAFVSVLKADKNPDVPMLYAKAKFEEELKNSGLNWVIFRPTGYFYDIAKVFMPMIEKGEVTLLGKKPVYANVVDTSDFANFIVEHMMDNGKIYNVGGKETYSYEELAKLFFAAAGKEVKIKRVPAMIFDVLAVLNKFKKNGKEAIIKFSKWTLTENMVGDTIVGESSFAEYIKNCYK